MGTIVKLYKTISGNNAEINYAAFSDSQLALASSHNSVHIYDNVIYEAKSPHRDHSYPVQCVNFSPDGSLIASCAMDGVCCIRHTSHDDVGSSSTQYIDPIVNQIQHRVNSPMRTLHFSSDGKLLVTGSIDSTACVWDVNNNMKLKCSVNIPETSIKVCAFTPCDRLFVVGTFNGNVNYFTTSGKKVFRNLAHDMGTSCIDISNKFTNGGLSTTSVYTVVTGGNDCILKLWRFYYNVNSVCKITLDNELCGHNASITSCQFSHDSRLIVSGSLDMTAQIWNANGGEHVYTISHHTRYVTCCCFSKNDQFIATASGDKTVVVWAVTSKLLKDGGYNGFNNLRSMLPLSYWSTKDVSDWLRNENFVSFISKFRDHNIDGLKFNNITDKFITDMFDKDNNVNTEDISCFLKKKQQICSPKNNQSAESDENTPHEFICPIKHEIMMDPVIASDGYSYERLEITRWIDQNSTKSSILSPMTGADLQHRSLLDNINLKIAIQRYQNFSRK